MKQIKNIIYHYIEKKYFILINAISFYEFMLVFDFSYNRLLNKNNIYYWIRANLRLQSISINSYRRIELINDATKKHRNDKWCNKEGYVLLHYI
jgi:hypothetical protein